jgi:hypothetical protein
MSAGPAQDRSDDGKPVDGEIEVGARLRGTTIP